MCFAAAFRSMLYGSGSEHGAGTTGTAGTRGVIYFRFNRGMFTLPPATRSTERALRNIHEQHDCRRVQRLFRIRKNLNEYVFD